MTSVSPDNVEDIQSVLKGNSAAIFPVGVDLTNGDFNVLAFQPNCKHNL